MQQLSYRLILYSPQMNLLPIAINFHQAHVFSERFLTHQTINERKIKTYKRTKLIRRKRRFEFLWRSHLITLNVFILGECQRCDELAISFIPYRFT